MNRIWKHPVINGPPRTGDLYEFIENDKWYLGVHDGSLQVDFSDLCNRVETNLVLVVHVLPVEGQVRVLIEGSLHYLSNQTLQIFFRKRSVSSQEDVT